MSIILSICVPVHNRGENIIDMVTELLRINSDEFDIVITDTSDPDKKSKSLENIKDSRLKIFYSSPDKTAMENWLTAIENADGIYCFHLNDRDKLNSRNLLVFISCLKENPGCLGGICKSIPFLEGEEKEYEYYTTPEQAVLNIPFFASHTTGNFFKTEELKKIDDREELFNIKMGTHPHDLILGRLAEKGNLMLYKKNIWEMASDHYYKNNKSGMNKKDEKYYFLPEERIRELKIFLNELKAIDVDENVKSKKKEQMVFTYLRLSTIGYFDYVQSIEQSCHYGFEPVSLSFIDKLRHIDKEIQVFSNEIGISEKKLYYKNRLFRELIVRDLQITMKNRNLGKLRTILKRILYHYRSKDSALLR